MANPRPAEPGLRAGRVGVHGGAGIALAAVSIFLLPAASRAGYAAAPSAAMIEEVEGLVRVTRASTGLVEEAEEDLALNRGDRIDTLDDGRVTISLSDEHLVSLAANSSFTIRDLRPSSVTGGLWASLRLAAGRLFASFGPLTGERAGIEIETPTAIAAVKGTTFSVEVEGGLDARVAVSDGSVRHVTVDRDGRRTGEVVVKAGYESLVRGWMKKPGLPAGIAKKRLAELTPHLDGVRERARLHRKMRRNGDLARLRECRHLARQGRLDEAGKDLGAFLKAHPAERAKIERHGKLHRDRLERRRGGTKHHREGLKRPAKSKRGPGKGGVPRRATKGGGKKRR